MAILRALDPFRLIQRSSSILLIQSGKHSLCDSQLCLVHLVRHLTKYVSYKDRKELAADLKTIYRAATAEQAEASLETFAAKWDARYPMISRSWRANWARVVPMFGFPEEIRRAVYTTNAIESLNQSCFIWH
jgi:putative transposase